MKNRKYMMIVSALSVLTLVSCSVEFSFPSVSLPEITHSSETTESETTSESETSESSKEESSKEDTSSIKTSSSSFDIVAGGPGEGFVTGPLKYKIDSFTNAYTPNEGHVNVLVVPLDLSSLSGAGSYTFDSWTESSLEFINTQYFGTGDVGAPVGHGYPSSYKYWTFKDYFEKTSNGKVTIEGEVLPVYKAKSAGISTINSNTTDLHKVFRMALRDLQDNNPEKDWAKFDLNDDGVFDAVHFISNFHGATWGQNLWPHQSQTGDTHDTGRIAVNNYSLSSIEKFENAQTCTHEQGHMFGLDDYYDYSPAPEGKTTYDFIGQWDMQYSNWFDWNSYSKLVTGWANPTVITGDKDSVTVSLRDAATSGDCLLVPADYSKFNNSPFDEYFLFELFSPKGYNEMPWQLFKSYGDLGYCGVRAYHVYGKQTGQTYDGWGHADGPFKEDGTPYDDYFTLNSVACNSANYADYNGSEQYKDYPLLSLLSRKDCSKYLKRNDTTLSSEDLWKAGDTFTWDKAKTGLIKDGIASTTMVDGETFPYEIHFDSMTKDLMTVTVTRK